MRSAITSTPPPTPKPSPQSLPPFQMPLEPHRRSPTPSPSPPLTPTPQPDAADAVCRARSTAINTLTDTATAAHPRRRCRLQQHTGAVRSLRRRHRHHHCSTAEDSLLVGSVWRCLERRRFDGELVRISQRNTTPNSNCEIEFDQRFGSGVRPQLLTSSHTPYNRVTLNHMVEVFEFHPPKPTLS